MTSKSKKIFIFSELIPYPLNGGGSIAQFYFLEKLSQTFDITYCTIVKSNDQKLSLQDLQTILPELKVKYFERQKESFTNTYFLKTIFFLKKTVAKIIQINSDNISKDQIARSAIRYYDKAIIEYFKELFHKENYDYIQLEFFEAITLLNILPSNAVKIFIHHEIRFKLLYSNEDCKSLYSSYLSKTVKDIELSLLSRADKVIVFNEDDKKLLSETNTDVIVSPFAIPQRLIKKQDESLSFDKFIFLGSSGHFPNKEGLIWFLDDIYIPLYSNSLPLIIIGKWEKQIKSKYKKFKKIIFKGYIPEVHPYFENSILICPIKSGSGIRTKILEAFANKVPVISTRLGSEGLYSMDESTTSHILLFDSKEEFKEILDKTVENSKFISDVAKKGYEYYEDIFNSTNLLEIRKSIYN